MIIGKTFLEVVGSTATVALIAAATRWIIGAQDALLPRTRNGNSVYGIKWQWRALGLGGGVFWLIVSIWSWYDLHHPDWVLIAIAGVFAALGLWLASGSVSTTETVITKSVLWESRSLCWKDITEIRLQTKQGGAIEVRAGSRKLLIDSRFVALQHLLSEIENRTRLQASKN